MKVDEQRIMTLRIERHDENWWSVHLEDSSGNSTATASGQTLGIAMVAIQQVVVFLVCEAG